MSNSNAPWSVANRAGLIITFLLGLYGLTGVFSPTPSGEVGPPLTILIAGSVLAVAAVVSAVIAWIRRSRVAARVAAGSIVLIALSAVPAFFVSVPAVVKILVAVTLIVTLLACVLVLRPAARPAASAV